MSEGLKRFLVAWWLELLVVAFWIAVVLPWLARIENGRDAPSRIDAHDRP